MITIIEPPAEQLSAGKKLQQLYVEVYRERLLAETPVITISNSNFNEPCAYNGTRYVCDFLIDDHDFDDGVHILREIMRRKIKKGNSILVREYYFRFYPATVERRFFTRGDYSNGVTQHLTVSADEALMGAGPEARSAATGTNLG